MKKQEVRSKKQCFMSLGRLKQKKMKKNDKTREQLLIELEKSNAKITELEKSETVHKQVEETLRESDKRYKNLYSMMRLMSDNLPDLIWTKDMEGKFLFVNKACSKILLDARDTDEPIGKTDIYFADRMIKSHPEIPDYLSFGKKCVESDLTVLKTRNSMRFDESGNIKGEFLFLDVFKAPFYDENRNIIGTVGCAKVVTKEKQMENELAKHREHLEELVQERTKELDEKNIELKRYNKLFEGREFRIKELRDKVKELEEKK